MLKEIKDKLFEAGFKSSYPYSNSLMVRYIREDKVCFDIYLDIKNPNKVDCLRGHTPGSTIADGIIGDFVGGKGRMRRFSFKTPDDLITKLNNIKVKLAN